MNLIWGQVTFRRIKTPSPFTEAPAVIIQSVYQDPMANHYDFNEVCSCCSGIMDLNNSKRMAPSFDHLQH